MHRSKYVYNLNNYTEYTPGLMHGIRTDALYHERCLESQQMHSSTVSLLSISLAAHVESASRAALHGNSEKGVGCRNSSTVPSP